MKTQFTDALKLISLNGYEITKFLNLLCNAILWPLFFLEHALPLVLSAYDPEDAFVNPQFPGIQSH